MFDFESTYPTATVFQKILKEAKLHNEDPKAAASGHAWKIFNDVGGHVDSKLGDKHMEAPDASNL